MREERPGSVWHNGQGVRWIVLAIFCRTEAEGVTLGDRLMVSWASRKPVRGVFSEPRFLLSVWSA